MLFAARIVACWSAGFLAVAYLPGLELATIDATIASLVNSLSLVLPGVAHAGNQVSAAGTSVQIVSECTSLTPTILLWGAIAAFPAPMHLKVAGVIAGSVILWLFNIARIGVLIMVLGHAPGIFDLIHVYLWQSLTLMVVVGLFVLWLRLSLARVTA